MTRINLIPPQQLADQHLLAEYKEIMRMPGYLQRSLQSKGGLSLDRIPSQFTLNTGHVTFFYNKGRFVRDRFRALKWELIARGYAPSKDLDMSQWPDHLMGGYTPTPLAIETSKQRIDTRLRHPKPGFVYTYWKRPLDPQWGIGFIDYLPPLQETPPC